MRRGRRGHGEHALPCPRRADATARPGNRRARRFGSGATTPAWQRPGLPDASRAILSATDDRVPSSAPLSFIRPAVRAMDGYTPGEQPQDGGYIKLNTNENPYPPSPRVREAIRGCATADVRLYPDPMATALRDAAAARYGLTREQVLAGNGSDELLAMVVRACVEPGRPGRLSVSDLQPLRHAGRDRRRRRPCACRGRTDFSLPPRARRGAGPRDVRLQSQRAVRHAACRVGGDRRSRRSVAAACWWSTRRTSTSPTTRRCGWCATARDNVARAAHVLQVVLARRHAHRPRLRPPRAHRRAGQGEGLLQPEPRQHRRRRSRRWRTTPAMRAARARASAAPASRLSERLARARLRRAAEPGQLRAGAPARAATSAPVYEALKQRRILVRYFATPELRDALRITVGTDAEVDALLGGAGAELGRALGAASSTGGSLAETRQRAAAAFRRTRRRLPRGAGGRRGCRKSAPLLVELLELEVAHAGRRCGCRRACAVYSVVGRLRRLASRARTVPSGAVLAARGDRERRRGEAVGREVAGAVGDDLGCP